MIHSRDISVIVQGAITKEYTGKCLDSIRTLLPDSEIILSSFVGAEYEGLSYDKIVLSVDPGAVLIDKVNHVYNNVNRQLVSTKAGFLYATRPYTLKFRSDLLLTSIDWLNYFRKYDQIAAPSLFRNRVLICNFYTRNPRILSLPYHMSDWIMFGNTDDLKQYYDTPLQDDHENRWFLNHKKSYSFFTNMTGRYFPEQYLCYSFLKKKNNIQLQDFYDASKKNMLLTERFIAENTVILDYKDQLGILFLKYNPKRYFENSTLIYHKDWKKLFSRYSLNDTSLNWRIYKIDCRLRLFFLIFFRKPIVSFLDVLHIKIKVKSFLNKWNH